MCDINVDFAPSATGSRVATLTVTDSGTDSATASLSGTGDDYEITLNGSPQEQSTFQGGTVTFNFNVTPVGVFGGVVTIVCPVSSQLPALTTCTPNPSSVTVTPGTPAPFSVTFATTFNGVIGGTATSAFLSPIVTGNRTKPPTRPSSALWAFPAILLVLGGTVVLRAFSGRPTLGWPRRQNLQWLLAALLVAYAALFLGACHHSTIQAGLSTPVGTTSLTIRGTAQNAGRGNTIILDVVAH
jgi:hypothetical protein